MTKADVKKKKAKKTNGIEFNDKRVSTPLFRVAYPALDKPTAYKKGDKESYSIHMLFPHDTDFKVPVNKNPKPGMPYASFQQAIKNAKIELWGPDKEDWPDKKKLILPIKDGDEKNHWEGFAGNYYIKANTYAPVKVYGTTPNPSGKGFMEINPALVQGGDYCRAIITASAYDDAKEPGVKFYLQSIQLVKKGEPFAAGGSDGSDFDDGVYENEYEEITDAVETEDDDEDVAPRKIAAKGKAPVEDEDDDIPQSRGDGKRQKFAYGAQELARKSNRKAHTIPDEDDDADDRWS